MQSPTAAEWLARAEEARVMAEQMTGPLSRQTMIGISAGYYRLARIAAARERAEQVVPERADDTY